MLLACAFPPQLPRLRSVVVLCLCCRCGGRIIVNEKNETHRAATQARKKGGEGGRCCCLLCFLTATRAQAHKQRVHHLRKTTLKRMAWYLTSRAKAVIWETQKSRKPPPHSLMREPSLSLFQQHQNCFFLLLKSLSTDHFPSLLLHPLVFLPRIRVLL